VGTIRLLRRGRLLLLVVAAALAVAAPAAAHPRRLELVVTLRSPSLAEASAHDRQLAALTTTARRLDFSSPSTLSYVAMLRAEQAAVAARIKRAIPSAFVHWHYTVTLNGLAVVVPASRAGELARVPGVARVWPTATFTPALDRTPQLIGAPALWGPTLATAGQGQKIAVVDEGVDQTHPFFNPAGYSYPPGYPKGNTSFTTPKVIVARAFAPATPKWKYANLPFDPQFSEHGTHVAGIAAGNHGAKATTFAGQPTVSGVAPAAYIGNYKALTVPTPGFGLDGNAPEIAKAIDQAVADGMDVINLSLGEPEIDPSRDIVVKALNAAADANVVPVVAAGNDFEQFGPGSVDSPGNTPKAITAAASTSGRGVPADVLADFSSGGPTPYSFQLKPDVTAPGAGVLSSVPARAGTWAVFDGTSMATPHVAGSAALLRQQHPTWTVAQLKSALEQTGDPVYTGNSRAAETSPLREGGGRIDLARANAPLLFASPSGVSFGLLKPGTTADRDVALTDAGGGAGTWSVRVGGSFVSTDATVTVPGTLHLHATVPAGTTATDSASFVLLTLGTNVRRIPFWLHVETPKLGRPSKTLTKNGTYTGDASKGQANVDRYLYPDVPTARPLPGPELVFAVPLKKPVANFGVRIISQSGSTVVTPRIVRDDDENRLAGYTALPFDLNAYRDRWGDQVPVAGVILPAAGTYDVVFDTAATSSAGKFTFRFWIDDTTPPKVKLLGYAHSQIRLSIVDAGSGVDASTLKAVVDGTGTAIALSGTRARIPIHLARGKHVVRVTVADWQETKNMEDVGPILPNTRSFVGTLRVR
jgi:subtilisin family serine protease